MTGAKQIMQAQAVNNHNIANSSTTGFRADGVAFTSEPIYGPGYATRVNAVAGTAADVPVQTIPAAAGRVRPAAALAFRHPPCIASTLTIMFS